MVEPINYRAILKKGLHVEHDCSLAKRKNQMVGTISGVEPLLHYPIDTMSNYLVVGRSNGSFGSPQIAYVCV